MRSPSVSSTTNRPTQPTVLDDLSGLGLVSRSVRLHSHERFG
jgi:hypothetical protein